MPDIITGDMSTDAYGTGVSFESDMSYSYPNGIDLRPSSVMHGKLLGELNRRVRESWDMISKRHEAMREVDKTLTAYIAQDKDEKDAKRKDSRKPTSIVIPESFANMDVLQTYWTGTFLSHPYFSYSPEGPEDGIGTALLENVIDKQMRRSKAGLAINTAGRDTIAYGFSAITPVWAQHNGWRMVSEPNLVFDPTSGRVMPGAPTRTQVPAVLFEGNQLESVDPYTYLPDPAAPLAEPQRGEYVGWFQRDTYPGLLRREQRGEFFNVKYLKGRPCQSHIMMGQAKGSDDKTGMSRSHYSNASSPIDTYSLYWDLIPNDWGLGPSVSPEKWLFRVAADTLIIQASPLNLKHNMFPVAVAAPDYDGRTMPISRMELIGGAQTMINFLFNSLAGNIRKGLHDQWIVDPSRVNVYDMEEPEQGLFIRLRAAGFGLGVRDVLQQFPVSNITNENLAHAQVLQGIAQKGTGALNPAMGMLEAKSGERRTAEESAGARQSVLARLQRFVQIGGMQQMQDLGYMLAHQTQQLMSRETYVKITGRWEQVLRENYGVTDPNVKVTPDMIDVDFDTQVSDGSASMGESAEDFMLMMDKASTNPIIGAISNVAGLYREWLRRKGIRDFSDFVGSGQRLPQIQVMPDAQIAQQAQAGNIAPMNEAVA